MLPQIKKPKQIKTIAQPTNAQYGYPGELHLFLQCRKTKPKRDPDFTTKTGSYDGLVGFWIMNGEWVACPVDHGADIDISHLQECSRTGYLMMTDHSENCASYSLHDSWIYLDMPTQHQYKDWKSTLELEHAIGLDAV